MPHRPLTRLLASGLAALIAVGATPHGLAVAHAEEVSKVLVLPFRSIRGQLDPSFGRKTAEILADDLHGNPQVLLVAAKPEPTPAKGAAAAAAPAAGSNPLAQAALRRIEAGSRMVKAFKFKEGAEEIEGGISDYELIPSAVNVNALREGHLQLAVALARANDAEGSDRALADAVRLAPEAPLTGNYPPVFKRQYEAAKKKIAAGPKGTVKVEGEGTVELDGRPLGAAPVTQGGVPVGAHFLKVARADGSAWGLKLSVSEGENAATIPAGDAPRTTPSITAAGLGPMDDNRIDDGVLAEIEKQGARAGADFVIFGGVWAAGSNVGAATHVYSLRRHESASLNPIFFDTDFIAAGIEVNKLGVQLNAVLRNFPKGEAIPGPVAAELGGPRVAVVTPDKRPDPVKPVEQKKPDEKKPDEKKPDEGAEVIKKPVVVVRNGGEKPVKPVEKDPVVGSDPDLVVRRPNRRDPDTEPVGGLGRENPKPKEDDDSGVPVWVWVAAGGAAIVGAGVGGYFLYRNQSTPVTGSATVSFQ